MSRYAQKSRAGNNQRRRKQGGKQKGYGRNSGTAARIKHHRAQADG